MSNIEIHGYGEAGNYNIRQHISAIISKSTLLYKAYQEIVITYIPSECYGISNVVSGVSAEKRPFLRVFGTDEGEIKYIAELLQKYGYEVETLLIHKFYSKP